MKICPRCQTQNPDNSSFCANCALQFNQSNQAPPKKKGVSTSIGILIAVGAMFFFCIISSIIIAVISPKKPEVAKNEVVNPTPTATSSVTDTKDSAKSSKQVKPAAAATPELPELEKVKAVWREGGFGAIAIWQVTIKNNTNKKLGDIKFKTGYYSETGNKVGSGGTDSMLGKDTIEKIVPPKSTRTFEVNDGFVNSEANTANFEIVSWREIP